MVQENTKKLDQKSLTVRHKFMIETLIDLKNNRRKKHGPSGAQDGSEQEARLLKQIKDSMKRRGLSIRPPLRPTLNDIMSAHTKGKWWMIGSAWVGHDSEEISSRTDEVVSGVNQSELIQLARQQKMNTDIRRSIFVVIMSSEDCTDCYEKLLKLRLTPAQQREIPRVLVHCCGAEVAYNPYYALVSRKFTDSNMSYKITFQYALWDFFKELEEEEKSHDKESRTLLRRIANCAKFYGYLLSTGALGLSILKVSFF